MGIEEIHTGSAEPAADDFDTSSLTRVGRDDLAARGVVETYDQSSHLGVVADRLGARGDDKGAPTVAVAGRVASRSTSSVTTAVTAGVGIQKARHAMQANVGAAQASSAASAVAGTGPAPQAPVEGIGPIKAFGYAVRGEEVPTSTPYRATFKEGFKAGLAGEEVRTKGVLRKRAPKPAPALDDNLGTTIGSAAGAGIGRVRSAIPGALADFQSLEGSDDFAEGMASAPANRVKRRVTSEVTQRATRAVKNHFKWKAPVSAEQKAKGVAGALEKGKRAPKAADASRRVWQQTSRRVAAARRSAAERARRALSVAVDGAGAPVAAAASAFVLAAVAVVAVLLIVMGGASQRANAASLTGAEREVAQFFLDKGLDAEHTAAVMGNIDQECGFDVGLIEDGSAGGVGLFQWPAGSEQEAMKSWCAANGYEWSSLRGQLEYCWAEMTGANGGAGGWGWSGEPGWQSFLDENALRGQPARLERWQSVSSVEVATEYFVWGFLRPSVAAANVHSRIYGDGAGHRGSLYFYDALTSNAGGLVGAAMSKEGCLYSWAADGPDVFDCSGFVSYCLRESGLAPEGYRKTAAGILADCTIISKSDAVAGDFVCYLSGGSCYHIGIYLGDGTVISANGSSSDHGDNPNAKVMVTQAEGYFAGDALYVRWQN